MSGATDLVTISIVSHGQGRLVEPLVRTIAALAAGTVAEVVVTKNIPENIGLHAGEFPWRLTVIENSRARGFGANHNAAFAFCSTPWFAIINPDIEIARDVFRDLLLAASNEDALVAPVLEGHEGIREEGRGLITPWEVLGRVLGAAGSGSALWYSGAFLLVRSELFSRVGGFDERYYMYVEDFDLCARFRLAGWSLRRVESVSVIHRAQRRSHRHLRYLFWHVQSLLKLWSNPVYWRFRRLLRSEDGQRGGEI